MISKFALTMLTALAICGPVQEAAAQDNTLGGALFGGAAGAIVGGAIGGGRGAAVGAIIGAGTGAAIASQGEPRPGGYRYYQNGCSVEQPGGWVAVSPRYCQTAAYDGPPPGAYAPAACARAAPTRRPMIHAAARSSAVTATSVPARRASRRRMGGAQRYHRLTGSIDGYRLRSTHPTKKS